MKFAILLITLTALLSFDSQSHSAEAFSRRCYPWLCRKCDLYLNSRMRRSAHHSHPSNSRYRESRHDIPRLDGALLEMMAEEENPVYGAATRAEELNIETIDGDPEASNRRMKKRSPFNHSVRCYFRLRTKCCKEYLTTTYIGYKL